MFLLFTNKSFLYIYKSIMLHICYQSVIIILFVFTLNISDAFLRHCPTTFINSFCCCFQTHVRLRFSLKFMLLVVSLHQQQVNRCSFHWICKSTFCSRIALLHFLECWILTWATQLVFLCPSLQIIQSARSPITLSAKRECD